MLKKGVYMRKKYIYLAAALSLGTVFSAFCENVGAEVDVFIENKSRAAIVVKMRNLITGGERRIDIAADDSALRSVGKLSAQDVLEYEYKGCAARCYTYEIPFEDLFGNGASQVRVVISSQRGYSGLWYFKHEVMALFDEESGESNDAYENEYQLILGG